MHNRYVSYFIGLRLVGFRPFSSAFPVEIKFCIEADVDSKDSLQKADDTAFDFARKTVNARYGNDNECVIRFRSSIGHNVRFDYKFKPDDFEKIASISAVP